MLIVLAIMSRVIDDVLRFSVNSALAEYAAGRMAAQQLVGVVTAATTGWGFGVGARLKH